jgi:hypothetical protein
MEKKIVTVAQLEAILFDVKTIKGIPTFASIVQVTTPKCTRKCRTSGTPNPYGKIEKVTEMSILLNSDYVKAVENQLLKEGKETTDYKQGKNPMPLEFGNNNQFVGLFNGEPVLQYRPNDNSKPKTIYLADSKEVSKDEIVGFLPKPSQPAENQGTEREILWRKVYLKNVKSLTFNKVTYIIVG